MVQFVNIFTGYTKLILEKIFTKEYKMMVIGLVPLVKINAFFYYPLLYH